MEQLQRTGTGRAFDVEQREAEVAELKAKLDGAAMESWTRPWCARRPTAMSPMSRSAKAREWTTFAGDGVHRHVGDRHRRGDPQIDARYVQPGQLVELTFKFIPGTVYPARSKPCCRP